MVNFQHYIKGTNSENIEFYIGKGSGNKIEKDLENAKKEITIISPYVSEEKIDLLLNKKNNGVKVKLAFSSLNDKQDNSIIQKIINRKHIVNTSLKDSIEKELKKLKAKSLLNVLINIFIFLIGSIYFKTSLFLINLVLFFLINNKLKKTKEKLLSTKIISYEYHKKLDFIYLNNNFRHDKMFIHSKIYIIDDDIAYLGSVNFTFKGFKENLETRIRITDRKTVSMLKNFTAELFKENQKLSHKLDWLGDVFYNEDKNITYQYFLDREFNNQNTSKTSNFEKVIQRNKNS